MVILDLITQLFPTGTGASTLHVALGDGNSFTGRHFPLVGLGLGLACFIAAAVKPICHLVALAVVRTQAEVGPIRFFAAPT